MVAQAFGLAAPVERPPTLAGFGAIANRPCHPAGPALRHQTPGAQ